MGNQIYNATLPPPPLHLLLSLSLTPTNNAPLSKRGLLKTHKCWQQDGLSVTVKIFWKASGHSVEEKLIIQQKKKLVEALLKKFHLLEQPNILNYHKITETEKAVCLIRQYCYISLTDRISTRPFLSQLNKLWLSYQILRGLTQLRESQFYHGDLKLTNVLLTAYDWVLLTDLAFHKPIHLPADNPSTFALFFSNVEGSAFLAPERFYDQDSSEDYQISDQQLLEHTLLSIEGFGDSFGRGARSHSGASSTGSVTTTTTTTTTTADGGGGSGASVTTTVSTSEQDTSPSPNDRQRSSSSASSGSNSTGKRDLSSNLHAMDVFSAGCIIAQLFLDVRALFNFEQLLAYRNGNHQHLDDALEKIENEHLREMIRHMLQVEPQNRLSANEYCEQWTPHLFPWFFKPLHRVLSTMVTDTCDERIERLYLVYNLIVDKIMKAEPPSMRKSNKKRANSQTRSENDTFQEDEAYWDPIVEEILVKSHQDISQMAQIDRIGCSYHEDLEHFTDPLQMEGMEIITSLVCASVRKAEKVENRVRGLQLIQSLAHHSTDYIRLQRLIPYTCTLLSDEAPLVKSAAIQTLAIVLKNIESFPPSESNLFSDYILDKLKKLGTDESEMVCVCFAEHLPFFAIHAKRFLDISMKSKSHNNLSVSMTQSTAGKEESYEEALAKLQSEILQMVVQTSMMHPCIYVKIGLLTNILELCKFYGIGKTNEEILPMIITFLNARSWRLRHAFFQKIVPISMFVGKVSLQQYILPCFIQAIYDSSEAVVEQALSDFVILCESDMLKKSTIIDLAQKIAPLLHHPNIWIRSAAISYISIASQQLGAVDSACFLLNILDAHLDYKILNLTEENIRQCIKPYLDRSVFDKAIRLKPENFHAMDQLQKSEDLNVFGSWTNMLASKSLTQKDADLLEMMKPYLMQYAVVQSTKIVDSEKADQGMAPSQIIDLDVEPRTLPKTVSATKNQSSTSQQQGRKTSDGRSSRAASNPQRYQQKIEKLSARSYPSIPSKELASFRPRGQFCGQSHQHESSIQCVSVHSSLRWFATAGRDYTVRVWNLDKSYSDSALIAQMTYNVDHVFGYVNAVSVFSHSQEDSFVACGTSNGWLIVFDANTGETVHRLLIDETGESTYFSPVDNFQQAPIHPSINCTHFVNFDGTSLVLCGSYSGIITAIDARRGRQAFKLQSDHYLQEGGITAICGESTWIVSGTNRGFLTLWDLRFQLPASNWRLSRELCLGSTSGVSALGMKENEGMAPWIYIATRSRDVVVWHLESHREARVLRVGDPKGKVRVRGARQIPKKSDELVEYLPPTPGKDNDLIRDESRELHEEDPYAKEEWADIEWDKLKNIEVTSLYVNPDGSFFTGSSDRFVRFWNPNGMKESRVISGLPRYEKARYHRVRQFPPIFEEVIFQDANEMEELKKSMPMFTIECHPDAITDVKVVAQEGVPTLLTTSRDGTLMLWR